jgi:membrane protease YdiL (CAAX protease family)
VEVATAPPVPAPPPPAIVDLVPERRTIPLAGVLERGGFSPLTLGILALFAALIATNAVGLVGAVFAALAEAQRTGQVDAEAVMERLMADPAAFLLLNAVGQWLGFALLAVMFARGHTRRPGEYLRWRAPTPAGLGLAIVGLIALTPVVQWLGGVTDTLPVPDWMAEMERQSTELIERALVGSGAGVPFLLATMALTPAVCEELLFRGYVHRQVERRLGPAWAIGLVSVLFGLYHLQPTKALPLALLGAWLGYITWTTGSIIPAVVVHFLNNGLAVAAGAYIERRGGDVEVLESMAVPIWAVAAGVAGTLAAGWALRRLHAARSLASEPAVPPTAVPTPPP